MGKLMGKTEISFQMLSVSHANRLFPLSTHHSPRREIALSSLWAEEILPQKSTSLTRPKIGIKKLGENEAIRAKGKTGRFSSPEFWLKVNTQRKRKASFPYFLQVECQERSVFEKFEQHICYINLSCFQLNKHCPTLMFVSSRLLTSKLSSFFVPFSVTRRRNPLTFSQ